MKNGLANIRLHGTSADLRKNDAHIGEFDLEMFVNEILQSRPHRRELIGQRMGRWIARNRSSLVDRLKCRCDVASKHNGHAFILSGNWPRLHDLNVRPPAS